MYYIKSCNKVYNWMRTDTLMLINISRTDEVFHDNIIFFTRLHIMLLDKGYINLYI